MAKTYTTIAYLDILGFGNHTKANVQEAVELLSNYRTIFKQKIVDMEIDPLESYPEKLQNLAKRTSIDSFELFLPFSDSLFVQSSDASNLVRQLSNFLLECFSYTSNAYSNPEDPINPSKVTLKSFEINNGQVEKKEEAYHWHPLLFRGGISYGEAYTFSMDAIVNSKLSAVTNTAGPALVKAVKVLEPLGKGPRLFCDSELIQQLNDDTRQYCCELPERHFEILWPAFHFIEKNGSEIEVNRICELLRPAANLWKAYNHMPYGIQYWEFVKLIVKSSIMFFELQNARKHAEKAILDCLRSVGLEDKKEALLGIKV